MNKLKNQLQKVMDLKIRNKTLTNQVNALNQMLMDNDRDLAQAQDHAINKMQDGGFETLTVGEFSASLNNEHDDITFKRHQA